MAAVKCGTGIAGYLLEIVKKTEVSKTKEPSGKVQIKVIARGLKKVLSLMALIITPALALAAPDLKIQMAAEKEIVVIEEGREVTRRVPTLEIESGSTLFFTLRISNEGDENATNVVVDNPIPEETIYVDGSAGGENTRIQFSIDNGESFAVADELVYQFTTFNGEKQERKAKPEMYTNVRWVVEDVQPGAREELFFQVKVN